ncbi:MAG: hypothetical protein KKC46_04055 [Proteobacteria bacterium]|nr:hypothetical protein [Pseudomonadota bacterium]
MGKVFKFIVIIAIFGPLINGCTSARISKSLASGSIGCPPNQIIITNETVYRGIHNFTATCEGIEYHCTYMYPNPINCKKSSSENINKKKSSLDDGVYN